MRSTNNRLRSAFEQRWFERFREFGECKDDDAGIAGWSPSGLRARLRLFVRIWDGGVPGAIWLDAGCGAGTYTRHLAEQRILPVGLDYSLTALKKAQARSPNKQIKGWVAGDVLNLPVQKSSVEGVICFGVTQALEDPRPTLRQLVLSLKPNGKIWIDGLNSWCLSNILEQLKRKLARKPTHLRYESPLVLRRAMRKAGLSGIRLYWLPIMPARFQRLQHMFEWRTIVWLIHKIPVLGALLSHSFVLCGMLRRSN